MKLRGMNLVFVYYFFFLYKFFSRLIGLILLVRPYLRILIGNQQNKRKCENAWNWMYGEIKNRNENWVGKMLTNTNTLGKIPHKKQKKTNGN